MSESLIPDPYSPDAVSERSLSRAQKQVLCDALGLNLRETTEAHIDFGAGMTCVSWTGSRRLRASEAAELLRQIADVQP